MSFKKNILVEKYLEEHSLVESNIKSFNDFIQNRIQQIVNELNENEKFVLNFEGGQLKYGLNDFAINVDYKDLNGRQYSASRQFSIRQTDANILQKAYYSLGFESLSKGIVIVIFTTGAVAFIMIIIWVFRRKNRVV